MTSFGKTDAQFGSLAVRRKKNQTVKKSVSFIFLAISGKFTRALLAHQIFSSKFQDFLKKISKYINCEKKSKQNIPKCIFYQNMSHFYKYFKTDFIFLLLSFLKRFPKF
jgi:hypothetical protein